MQEAWNSLNPADVLTFDQYELAEQTGIPAAQWSKFLRDGQVQKYIDQETELFKQAQMRKLIARSTTNDKSVGTAQMLNAIGKTLEDESAETNFFIYSYVPLTPNECNAPMVTQDLRWEPPKVIKEEVEQPMELEKPVMPEVQEQTNEEVKDDDWF